MRGSRRLWLIVLAVTVSVVASAGLLVHRNSSASSTTVNTTTTTVPKGPWAAPEKGWTVVSVTHRGVALDRRTVWVGGAPFTVARFRKGTVAFHWHAGYVDPPHAIYTLPGDATNHIVWPNEGHVGVLAVFNGGFKLSAHAGGIIHDGQVLAPLIDGLATVAIDANGQMRLGQWGRDLSRTSFPAATYRQNLPLLVSRGLEAPSAVRGDLAAWGSWFGPRPEVPRSALGVDREGNTLFVATMSLVTPDQLGRALVKAGAYNAMELDINPFWPTLGLAHHALHNGSQFFSFSLPQARHRPDVYTVGWQRDFFVVLAEPASSTCRVTTLVTGPLGQKRNRSVHFAGTSCPKFRTHR